MSVACMMHPIFYLHSAASVRGLVATEYTPAGAKLLQVPHRSSLVFPYTDSALAAPILLREVLFHRRLMRLQDSRDDGGSAVLQLQQHRGRSRKGQGGMQECTAAGWRPRAPPAFLATLPSPKDLLTGGSSGCPAHPCELKWLIRSVLGWTLSRSMFLCAAHLPLLRAVQLCSGRAAWTLQDEIERIAVLLEDLKVPESA